MPICEGLARRKTIWHLGHSDAEAMQCGYCVPGMILTATALLERNATPTDAEIVDGMNGNLCRCCGYKNLIEAVKLAADRGAADA